jgi:flagellar assembly protein FliH
LSSRVYKSNEIKLGIPFKISIPGYYEGKSHTEEIINAACEVKGNYISDHIKYTSKKMLDNALIQADEIIKNAELEAKTIIENAAKEVCDKTQKIEEQARTKGYDKGVEEGKREYQELIKRLEQERQYVKNEYKKAISNLESDAIKLIIEISRKLVGDSLREDTKSLLELIRQGLERCINKDNIILTVSPEDYELVIKNRDILYSMVTGMGELEIISDQNLAPASCVVETPYGCVDAGMNTRLGRIEEMINKIASNGKSIKMGGISEGY